MNSTRAAYSKFFLLIVSLVCFGIFDAGAADNPRQVQNLTAFTRLYGYVKYFHPSDEASRIDWDKFAIYGSKKVIGAQNAEDLKTVLEELFLPIAPLIQVYYSKDEPVPLVFPEDTRDLNIVAWQHTGMGIGTSNFLYQSIRSNRENLISKTGYGFGTITQAVDAIPHRGKEIRLQASVRTDVSGSGNQGQLWLRVDRENKQRGFFDNMNDKPIKSKEWRTYEIIGTVAEDATEIFFGCFLKGAGQVWVDDFQLSRKNIDDTWEAIQIMNPGFEEIFGNKSKFWAAASPGYTYLIEGENPYKGNNSILIENKGERFSGLLFNKLPEFGETINKKIGSGLSCQIPIALYSDSKGTIGPKNKAASDYIFEQLDNIEIHNLTANDEYVRIANIVIAWNVFQHFYPYFDVVGVDWESTLTNTLTEVLNNQNEEEFYYTLKKMIAQLQDGHGGVYHQMSSAQAGLPFLVDWVENQAIVTFSKDEANFKVGDIVVSIDGIPSEKVLLEKEKHISGSPQWKRASSLRLFSYGNEGTEAKVQINRNGQILEIEAPRDSKEMLSETGRSNNIEEIESNIYYVNLCKAEMTEINKKIDDLSQAKGIIFDLRGYPNGNHDVICHLMTAPDTSTAWMRVPQIIYPDQENIVGFTEHGWYLQPKEPHINGKVVFLTDGRAISYAESFMSFIEHYKLADIVGEPTAGTNGNVNPFQLPGGFRVTWTGMKVLKHDGSQHHLIGIQPTVTARRTIKGIIENRDEYLEIALEVINSES